MNVNISWTEHSRAYTIGIKQFLAALGIKKTEEEIKAAAVKLLEQNEVKPK